ncbi:hypothetical protein [Thalassobacillus sp. CUG 92003]|uniref:hypothetical protein n=1 Tax=Thalassobacillus sp. CUG 92003 TaxID=2736641 RepID=UPI0015E62CAF|nr:hypothetical protein [Thalassobacillus sp. CUG 92003]
MSCYDDYRKISELETEIQELKDQLQALRQWPPKKDQKKGVKNEDKFYVKDIGNPEIKIKNEQNIYAFVIVLFLFLQLGGLANGAEPENGPGEVDAEVLTMVKNLLANQ